MTSTGLRPKPGDPAVVGGPRLSVGAAPPWLEGVVVVSACAIVSFGGIGLLLADVGDFSPPLALALGAVGTVLGTTLARPRWSDGKNAEARPAIVMIVVAVVVAIWNAAYAGHHVWVDSDPGVYAATGRWLATHHSLVIPAGTHFAQSGLSVSVTSPGIYATGGHTAQFQFVHLLPALLAQAYYVGGDSLMFRLNAVIGALGLCAVYVVGCRVTRRPWLVLVAVAALGVSLPDLYVARDTFSEPVSQLLLWGGIYLMIRSYEEGRGNVAVVAGATIGSTVMAHIDSVAYLAPVPLLVALAWLAGDASGRPVRLRNIGLFVVAAVAPSLLGTFDVQRRAGRYYSDLQNHVVLLYLLLTVSALIALALSLARPWILRAGPWLAERRSRIAFGMAWVVGLGLIGAWALRPAGPKATGSPSSVVAAIQKAESLPLVPTRTYAEQSMRWLEWYIGPVALALGIAGLCLLTVRALRRGAAPALIVLAMSAPLTAIYLWAPSITPDQVWAARRYVPASLPLLFLAAACCLEAVRSAAPARSRPTSWSRGAIVLAAGAIVAFPLATTLPLGRFQSDANFLPLVSHTCDQLGPKAVVVFPRGDPDAAALMQTLRSWCGVPVGQLAAAATATELGQAATIYHSEGESLWLLASTPQAITAVTPDTPPRLIGQASSTREIVPTLSRAPSRYGTIVLAIYGIELSSAPVPAAR